jgi:uncharacterized membrane protein (DUF2068 family)
MIIELTRKHAVLFAVLFAVQLLGLWLVLSRSPIFACLPGSIGLWIFFLFPMATGSAFLSTVVVMESIRKAFGKHR